MAKETRQKILDEAVDMLGEEGFAGLTLGTLALRAGISKSGLFAHFKSKTELESQVVDYSITNGQILFVEKAMAKPKGLQRLKALFEGWIGWTAKAGLKGGCPIAAGFFELDDLPEDNPTRLKLEVIASKYHQFLLTLCKDAVGTGELKKNLDSEQFVFEMYGIYLSHHVSLRFNKDKFADRRAMLAFKRLLEDNKRIK